MTHAFKGSKERVKREEGDEEEAGVGVDERIDHENCLHTTHTRRYLIFSPLIHFRLPMRPFLSPPSQLDTKELLVSVEQTYSHIRTHGKQSV